MIAMNRYAIGSLVLITAALAARSSLAANKLNIGDPAPQWTSIVGTDDKPHSLADYKDAKAVVVVFTCNHCPVAKAYQERLVALQKDYKPKGVQVIALCVNKNPGDDLDAMKKRAESAGFNFPYLYDPTQQAGRDYGATCTPHAFLLDKDRKLVYMGAIDDEMHADKVKKHHLRAALDALLDGKTPETPVTLQFGCGIRYEEEK
jgi:peroxiredoxin